MPLPDFNGLLGIKRAFHLLRRATFGATKQQLDAFALLTPAQAIPLSFHQALPDLELPKDPKTGSEWITLGRTDANSDDFELRGYLVRWLIGQMMSVGIPANLSLAYSTREKLVLFLHTHFTTIREKVENSRALYYQN